MPILKTNSNHMISVLYIFYNQIIFKLQNKLYPLFFYISFGFISSLAFLSFYCFLFLIKIHHFNLSFFKSFNFLFLHLFLILYSYFWNLKSHELKTFFIYEKKAPHFIHRKVDTFFLKKSIVFSFLLFLFVLSCFDSFIISFLIYFNNNFLL